MNKIIDCFIFYNEIELLNYRLNVLNDVVDYFVIVESTHTFTGKEKPLFFNQNKNIFEKFKEKIVHIIVSDFPYKFPNINFHKSEQWENEFFQRNAISRGIDYLCLSDNDIIIISDLDEIPDPNTLNYIKSYNSLGSYLNKLEMDLYYYNLNTKFDFKWDGSKILLYKVYKDLQLTCSEIRKISDCNIVKNGGWHLSYFGDEYFIKNKITNFSHQELNIDYFVDLSMIKNRITNTKDLYDRQLPIRRIELHENLYLPLYYDKYLTKYFSMQNININTM